MTIIQYAALLEYIAKNNSWGPNMYNVTQERHRRAIKYVEASFDTRDGTIWKVTFKQIISGSLSADSTYFTFESPDSIKYIYEWLDEVVR